jgi:hypothetical protein
MEPALIVALAAALIGPVVTFLVAARRLSGRIGTSDASDLWTEGAAMRRVLQERLTAEEARRVVAEERCDRLETENRELRRRVFDLELEIRRGGSG